MNKIYTIAHCWEKFCPSQRTLPITVRFICSLRRTLRNYGKKYHNYFCFFFIIEKYRKMNILKIIDTEVQLKNNFWWLFLSRNISCVAFYTIHDSFDRTCNVLLPRSKKNVLCCRILMNSKG